MCCTDFTKSLYLKKDLLAKFSIECAAAKEPKNKDNSSSIPSFKHKDITANIVSPEPILSIIFDANAGQ